MLAMLAGCLSGCSKRETTPQNKTVLVMTINDSSIYLDEVLYQVWKTELENDQYRSSFEEQYKKNYWESEIVNGVTTRDSLKEELYDTIVRETILYDKAISEGYTLTEKEKKTCKENAEETLSGMPEDQKETIGADLSFLKKMEEKKALVSKYFADVMETYQVDEDEAVKDIKKEEYTQYDVETIGFSKITYNQDGTQVKKSDELNEMGYESLKEVLKEAKKAENLEDVLTDPNTTLESEDYSFTPNDGSCEEAIEKTVVKMKPGDTSNIIETDTGYYIVRLVKNTSSDSYKDAKENAIKQAKYKQFDVYYNKLKNSADVETMKQWKKIVIGGTVLKEEQ